MYHEAQSTPKIDMMVTNDEIGNYRMIMGAVKPAMKLTIKT